MNSSLSRCFGGRGLLRGEEPAVGLCFLGQGEGVGAGGGGHAPEGEAVGEFDFPADGRDRAGEAGGGEGGGFFAGGDEGAAGGDAAQQGPDVGGGDDFQEGVGGVVTQASDLGGGVVESEAPAGAEVADGGFVEAFFGREAEVVFVSEVDEAQDAPEIVDPVGVEEGDGPAGRRGREAAEEENAGAFGEEGREGVLLSGHGR